MHPLEGSHVLITGGTGSLGQVLVRRLLGGEMGQPAKIVVFSRDEAKQHAMRIAYLHRRAVTDEVIRGEISTFGRPPAHALQETADGDAELLR